MNTMNLKINCLINNTTKRSFKKLKIKTEMEIEVERERVRERHKILVDSVIIIKMMMSMEEKLK